MNDENKYFFLIRKFTMPVFFSPIGKQPDLITGFIRLRVPAGQATVGPPGKSLLSSGE